MTWNLKNNLGTQHSLYLKQHAQDPIHWQIYGKDAFALALQENKLLFLSIGYSSCHWCHVMGHESFQSQEVADFVNAHYICIKIDREEWPDVDQYYQKMALYMGKHGGWPLSVFLTPEKLPIFIGTYFPLNDTAQMPSFLKVCRDLKQIYAQELPQIKSNAAKLFEKLQETATSIKPVDFQGHFPSALSILKAIAPYFDAENGGYGKAPKFPQFAFYEGMLEQILEGVVDNKEQLPIFLTLDKMLCGGIFDQARGGIHRYATDDRWIIPHFEKMLYDQAGLLRVLAKYSQLKPQPHIIQALAQTLEYLRNEMQDESGYFFSAQDADSEGTEGLFFCFTLEEFEDALIKFDEDLLDHMDNIKTWLGITQAGNFEQGLNIITLKYEAKEEMFLPENWQIISKVKQALFNARKLRIPPATDNKGIASINAALLSSLIEIIQYCPLQEIKNMAHILLKEGMLGFQKTFLHENLPHNYKIQHCTTLQQDTQFFEDYVFTAELFFKLYQLSGEQRFYDKSYQIMQLIEQKFIKDDICYTTELQASEIIDNIAASHFDQSFRSPVATFLGLKIKIDLLTNKLGPWEHNKLYQSVRAQALQNPLSHGEALRYLIYPLMTYKKLQVPRRWILQVSFQKLLPFFSHRFVFHYHDETTDEWQICHLHTCEAQGSDFESFKSLVSGNKKADH